MKPQKFKHAFRLITQESFLLSVVAVLLVVFAGSADADFTATDPGVRGGPQGAGGPLPGLTQAQLTFFYAGLDTFNEVESVRGTIPGTGFGLGPRFNLDSCGGCHAQPASGGTSPFVNPQVAVAGKAGAQNVVPFFITPNGPVREARFKFNPDGTRDGGVHGLFTISGRLDARGCSIAQPDFVTAAKSNNLVFRIPTPVFGAGLIENIPDDVIIQNKNSNPYLKRALGIAGHENRSANDGSITRFGWKAQVKSLLVFAGEAYNVEMGVTNELFPQERDETPGCLFNPLPEDHTNYDATLITDVSGDIEMFAFFMRLLAPPTPASDSPSIKSGRRLFNQIGCGLCHTPALSTGATLIAALGNQPVNLFSDLLLHHMGKGLADDIVQGNAGPDEFRTAPLWGLGQRIYFLHDGRTGDLLEVIAAHKSEGSEASAVIRNFNSLRANQKQDILNFLRSL